MGQLKSRPNTEFVREPCVLLKYTTNTDETVGTGEIDGGREERRSRRRWPTLHFRRAAKYDLVQAEKEFQDNWELYRRFSQAPTSEVLPAAEEQPELDLLVKAPTSEVLPAAEEQPELDLLVKAPTSEVLPAAEEQPELDLLVKAPTSEVLPAAEEQPELDLLVKAPTSEVLPAAEEQPELDLLVKAPTSEVLPAAEEQPELDLLVKAPTSEVLPAAEEQPELDLLVKAPTSEVLPAAEEQPELDLLVKAPTSEVLPAAEEQPELDLLVKAPTSEVLPAAEEQPELDLLVKAPTSEVLPAAEEHPELGVLLKSPICERYEIGQKLGEGAFGSVYEGTRRVDGLKVAVKLSMKFPKMPYVEVPGHLKRLPKEIGLTLMANKGCQVPEIIKMLDWEDNTDHYIMVLERPYPCTDMSSFMKLHGGKLDEQTARHVMRQVVRAAQISCERGVFHREIKLQNLLVNQDTMEVKLTDFGCGARMKNTAFDVFSGTEAYCPPEADLCGKYYTKPMTVWALGLLLFAMVCGTYPSASDLHMINANIWTRPGLSQECCRMICSCLRPWQNHRPILEKVHLHDWFKVMESDTEKSDDNSFHDHPLSPVFRQLWRLL